MRVSFVVETETDDVDNYVMRWSTTVGASWKTAWGVAAKTTVRYQFEKMSNACLDGKSPVCAAIFVFFVQTIDNSRYRIY